VHAFFDAICGTAYWNAGYELGKDSLTRDCHNRTAPSVACGDELSMFRNPQGNFSVMTLPAAMINGLRALCEMKDSDHELIVKLYGEQYHADRKSTEDAVSLTYSILCP
jgi:hypothetical protein